MAIDLKKYICEVSKTQKFIVKLAAKPEEDKFNYMKKMLGFKGMSSISELKQLPFNPAPTDFPRLKGFIGEIYELEMEFEYPMTETLLRNEISNYLELGFAYIIVRTAESPLEEYADDYLTIDDKNYEDDLLVKKFGDVNISDWFGEEHNKNIHKAIEDSEASVKDQWSEIEPKE